MKASTGTTNLRQEFTCCRTSRRWLAAAVLAVVAFGPGGPVGGRAEDPDREESGAQVLTRGPVHEAFAGIVSFNPEPGVVVNQSPPDLIEEVPPDQRPEGDNLAWIPGYWAWDDERNDFLWLSGTWRALPPGREWVAGYWSETSAGYQWISGYWADASVTETIYLPEPPATVEAGANIEAPSDDYGWTPGCWLWIQGRYAWRPGYWAEGRADWDWTPAHYVWTPRGYIFVEGFWDYPVERRGLLFAPVYFESRVYSRRGYHYSPAIVIDLDVFTDHLFLRPRYQHYYFGDYYAARYQQGGIYASFSFQSSHRGYDPFYSHQRWEHRRDREWEQRVAASYQYRRENESARPSRSWSAQGSVTVRPPGSSPDRQHVAVSIEQLARRKDGPVRFQPVAPPEKQQLAQRGQEVQRSRDQRRTLEMKPENASDRKSHADLEPARVQSPRSPIVAGPAKQPPKNQPPPGHPQARQAELNPQPKPERQERLPEGAPPKSGAGPRPPATKQSANPVRDRPAKPDAPHPRDNDEAPTHTRESPQQAQPPTPPHRMPKDESPPQVPVPEPQASHQAPAPEKKPPRQPKREAPRPSQKEPRPDDLPPPPPADTPPPP